MVDRQHTQRNYRVSQFSIHSSMNFNTWRRTRTVSCLRYGISFLTDNRSCRRAIWNVPYLPHTWMKHTRNYTCSKNQANCQRMRNDVAVFRVRPWGRPRSAASYSCSYQLGGRFCEKCYGGQGWGRAVDGRQSSVVSVGCWRVVLTACSDSGGFPSLKGESLTLYPSFVSVTDVIILFSTSGH